MQRVINGLLYDTKNLKLILDVNEKGIIEIILNMLGGKKERIYKANNGDLVLYTKDSTGVEGLSILDLRFIKSKYIRGSEEEEDYNKMLPEYKKDIIYMYLFFTRQYWFLKRQYPQYNYRNCEILYKNGGSMLCKNKLGELFHDNGSRIGVGFKIEDSEKFNRYLFDYICGFSLKDAEKRFPQFKYERA